MRFIFIAIVSLLVTGALAESLSAERVARDIDREGARRVVARLWANGDYDKVMDRIDTGDGGWIALAPKLAQGADAGAAEELPIALAFALPKNPRAVLAILGTPDGFPVEDVCSAPFIEGTVKDIPAYVKRARQAVGAVSDPALLKARDACLAQLRKI